MRLLGTRYPSFGLLPAGAALALALGAVLAPSPTEGPHWPPSFSEQVLITGSGLPTVPPGGEVVLYTVPPDAYFVGTNTGDPPYTDRTFFERTANGDRPAVVGQFGFPFRPGADVVAKNISASQDLEPSTLRLVGYLAGSALGSVSPSWPPPASALVCEEAPAIDIAPGSDAVVYTVPPDAGLVLLELQVPESDYDFRVVVLERWNGVDVLLAGAQSTIGGDLPPRSFKSEGPAGIRLRPGAQLVVANLPQSRDSVSTRSMQITGYLLR